MGTQPNRRNRWMVPSLALLASLGAVSSASAAVINVGTHYLFEDMPGQQIVLMVSAAPSEQVSGLNFRATIADGGVLAGGTVDGPIFQAVNLITGTIFAGNNDGQDDLGSLPQVATYAVVTQSGTINPNGVLAVLTIDTTGYFAGEEFDLQLHEPLHTSGTLTDFVGTGVTITHGSIVLVPIPEPGTIGLLLAMGGTLLLRRQRA